MTTYADQVYQNAYSIEYMWHNYLPNFVYKFHELMYREFNTPVSLQMGTLLPFISSLCGPKTRGKWTTRESVINFFTINVASSGCGKTVCRTQLISDPLEYIMENIQGEPFPDMEVNKFTRAGIEDKLRSTGGYCILTTDEGTGFFKDLKNKETKHESDLSLLNQLYDGKGDKTTLAKEVQRVIPKNSTSMCISLQQEGFLAGIQSLGYQSWCDSGFCERFMISACRPYRHKEPEKKAASKLLLDQYGYDFMGKVALGIFNFHKDKNLTYVLDEEAEKIYESVVDKYNEQFNLKWSNSQDSNNVLDSQERSEIAVRSKATELIGRLSIILWIYINAFECIHFAKPFNIPSRVSAECVINADKIIRKSYAHAETFSSSAFSNEATKNSSTLGKPKTSDTNKVLMGVIRTPSCIVNLRMLQKMHCRGMYIDHVRDELKLLEEEGFGQLFLTEEQKRHGNSKDLEFKHQNVFFKPAPFHLEKKFITRLKDKDITEEFYCAQFRKEIPKELIPCVQKFHPHARDIDLTQSHSMLLGSSKSMQQLDGNVKTSIFGTKKIKKITTTDQSREDNSKSAKPETSNDKSVPRNLKNKEEKGRKTVASEELATPDLLLHCTDDSDDQSANDFSSDLYSSAGESSKNETSTKQNKAKSRNSYVQIESNKTSSNTITEKVTRTKEDVKVIKTSTKGGFSTQDLIDCVNDSSFEKENNPANISVKRKISNSNTEITKESKEETSIRTQRPVRAATKKYKFRPCTKSVPETQNSQSSGKSSQGSMKNKKKTCSVVIPESNSDKSDFQPEPSLNLSKRIRRISRKQRDINKSECFKNSKK